MQGRPQLPDKATITAMATIINIRDKFKNGAMPVAQCKTSLDRKTAPDFNGLLYDDAHEIKTLRYRDMVAYPVIHQVAKNKNGFKPELSYGYCDILGTQLPEYLLFAPFELNAAIVVHEHDLSDERSWVRIEFKVNVTTNPRYSEIITIAVKSDGTIEPI